MKNKIHPPLLQKIQWLTNCLRVNDCRLFRVIRVEYVATKITIYRYLSLNIICASTRVSCAPCACHSGVLKTIGPWKLKTHFGFRIENRKRVSCPSVSRVSIFAGAFIEYEIPMHMSYASSKPCCPSVYTYNFCAQNVFSFYVIGFFLVNALQDGWHVLEGRDLRNGLETPVGKNERKQNE